jgi:ketosteroid isomerase-like protein
MPETPADSIDLPVAVRALRDAMNSHDPQRVADCFTTDYEVVTPLQPAMGFVGNDNVLRNWTQIFAGIPDLYAEVLRTAVNGTEVWSEWWMTGTKVNGEPAQLGGPAIWTERDGLVASARFYLQQVA